MAEKEKIAKKIKKECIVFFEKVNDIISVFMDRKGKIVYINPAVKKIFGFEQKEIIGRNFKELSGLVIKPESAKKINRYFNQRLRGKKTPNHYEFSGISKKGKEIFFEATTFPILKKSKIMGFFAIIRDISEKKKMIEKTKESEDLLKNIFKSSPNSITVTNLQGKIIKCNKETLNMHGFSSEKELIGRSAFILISEKDRQRAFRNMEKTLKTGSLKNIEYSFLKKNKKEFSAELSVSVMRNSFGQPVGFVAITKDISERKRVEQIKSDFVSISSHQFRIPITLMSWYSEMLINNKAGKINSKQRRYLEEINSSSQRLAKLITLLLNISRLELGIFSSRSKAINVIELANRVIEGFLAEIKNKNLKIRKNFEKNMPFFETDPEIMSLVMQNLISNAVKYTPKRGKIGISIKKQKSNILISVSDTGCGIPKSQHSRVFSKFFRAENVKEKKEKEKGNGLGLYIIKLILDYCGGKIWFRSKENKGTIFYVLIPGSLSGKKV